jgi:ABC-type transport system involved in multi-copper enzyme maturation permease subunit
MIFQLLVMLPASHLPDKKTQVVFWPGQIEAQSLLDIRRAELQAWTTSWNRLVLLLLQELFWWIVLVTPAVTAGALGHEKERGTLLALFGTQLYSSEIVIGKMLGRLSMVILPALAALPLLVLATILGELSPFGVILAVALVVIVMLAVGSASMLTAVWTRRTIDAILACYAALVIFCLGTVLVFPNSPLTDWIDPAGTLEQIVTGVGRWRLTILWPFFILSGVTAACLALAIWRLRPACTRQQEQRAKRWLWAYRRPMGNDPVAWRERHAIGLAPVPWLRLIPAWMGWIGVFTFSGIVAYDAANYSTSHLLATNLENGNLLGAMQSLSRADVGRVEGNLHVMGVVLVLGSSIIIGARCSNCISEEKRRKTWEDLIITPLTRKQIMEGKRRGVLFAAGPPFFAYALPMLGLAAMIGDTGLVIAGIYLVVAGMAMIAAAYIGVSWADSNDGLSWDQAARLQELIDLTAIYAGREPDNHSALRRLAKRHDALVAHSDAAGVLLLRADGQVLEVPRGPDGQVLGVAHGSESRAKPASSYRWLVARVSAARLFPELRVLLPLRPKHADRCLACGGSGLDRYSNTPGKVLCQTCTGLGWVYIAPPTARAHEVDPERTEDVVIRANGVDLPAV